VRTAHTLRLEPTRTVRPDRRHVRRFAETSSRRREGERSVRGCPWTKVAFELLANGSTNASRCGSVSEARVCQRSRRKKSGQTESANTASVAAHSAWAARLPREFTVLAFRRIVKMRGACRSDGVAPHRRASDRSRYTIGPWSTRRATAAKAGHLAHRLMSASSSDQTTQRKARSRAWSKLDDAYVRGLNHAASGTKRNPVSLGGSRRRARHGGERTYYPLLPPSALISHASASAKASRVDSPSTGVASWTRTGPSRRSLPVRTSCS